MPYLQPNFKRFVQDVKNMVILDSGGNHLFAKELSCIRQKVKINLATVHLERLNSAVEKRAEKVVLFKKK